MKNPLQGPPRAGDQPLFAGLQVLDLSSMIMVPAAAGLLADFGADVIKVEPLQGELNRRGHQIPGMPVHADEYCTFPDNRNKKSLAVDLKHPEGRSVLHRLVRRADVFLTNLRHQPLRRLELDYETLSQLNKGLIYAHGTGYGDAGPEADQPGFDSVCYWSRSSLELSMFPEQGFPGTPTYGSGDHPSGMTLYAAILMALLHRERTGEGQRVATSLLANGAWANSVMIQAQLVGAQFQERRPRQDPRNFAALHYLAADGRPFKITIIDHQRLWPNLCKAAGLEHLIEDPRYSTLEARAVRMGELVRHFEGAFARRTLAEWKERCRRHDVPFSALATYEDVAKDEQMAADGVFLELPHPNDSTQPLTTVDNPIRTEKPLRARSQGPPRLAQHSLEVLRAAHFSREEIERLVADRVIAVESRSDSLG